VVLKHGPYTVQLLGRRSENERAKLVVKRLEKSQMILVLFYIYFLRHSRRKDGFKQVALSHHHWCKQATTTTEIVPIANDKYEDFVGRANMSNAACATTQ
jgi:hypothetical protein